MTIQPVDLHFKRYDAPQSEASFRPPLVILHGLLGSGGNWHTLASKAFAGRAPVYVVDLRNHGRSPHDDRFDYPAMVADLAHFFDARGLSDAAVLGHSLGGKVAMHFALEHADRVERLVVVDIAPRAYPPRHRPIFDALRSVDFGRVEDRSDVDTQLAETIPSRPVRQFLLKNLSYDAETGTYSWQPAVDVIFDNYDRINEAVENGRTYEGPTLFVRGGTSDYVTSEDEADVRRLFPRAETETIAGAGHWVHADGPDAFADIVLEFLDR